MNLRSGRMYDPRANSLARLQTPPPSSSGSESRYDRNLRSSASYSTIHNLLPDPLANAFVNHPAPAVVQPDLDLDRKRLPLKPFTGRESVIHFFKRLEKTATAKAWNQATLLAWVPVLMEGPASLFYDSLAEAYKGNYDDLKGAFIERFNGPEERNKRMIQLGNIRQGLGEDVLNYYTRVVNLAMSAYNGIDAEHMRPMLLNHF